MSLELRPRLALRLTAVGFLAVLLQVSGLSQIQVFGVNADVLPLVVAAVGLSCGSLTGAVFGFGAGLFLDLLLVHTAGLSSLVYIAVGYWSGRLRELRDPQGPLVPIAVGAAGAAVAVIGYSLMQFLLGVDAPVSSNLLREILSTIVLDALIALPVMALVRRALGRDAPDDPRRRRRRRAYTTGGLSPLQRA